MRKFFRSRKTWITIVTMVIIWVAYYVSIILNVVTPDNNSIIFPIMITSTVTIATMCIGGHVWKDWIVSKHYRKELNDSVGGN
jgi:hypothetical protein